MSALEEMRERVQEQAAKGPKRARKAWVPPDPSRFRHITVLGLDQTLTHTGFSLVSNGYGGPVIHAAATSALARS